MYNQAHVFRDYAKFHQNRLFRCQDIAIFQCLNTAAVHRIEFLLFSEDFGVLRSTTLPNFEKNFFNSLQRYGDLFRFSKMAALHHLAFAGWFWYNQQRLVYLEVSVMVQNLVDILQ